MQAEIISPVPDALQPSARRALVKPAVTVVDMTILTAAILAPAVAAYHLVHTLGWIFGLLAVWIVLPAAAFAGAFCTFVWTIPFRQRDVLSVRRPIDDGTHGDVASASPAAISVIMPAYNAMHFLPRSLPPLMDLVERRAVCEVIVIDDGSTDDTASYARSLGARVIASSGRVGPGGARNEAARHAIGELLWFVDADVVVHPDTAQYVSAAFHEEEVVAAFGSYDDRPTAQNFGSQYKNLVHHHYHQHGDRNASTFWSGCGAVRKDAFLAIGGFDAQKFRIPSVEDVDLGYRLRGAGGLIRLDRRLLSTHLKVWSVVELVRTDIFRRAIPWARMMLNRTEILDDLNVGTAERLRALLAGAIFACIPLAAFGLVPAWALAILLLTALTGNWHLFRLFLRVRGQVFAAAGLAFHQIYYLYSSASFALCWAEARLLRRHAVRA